MSINRWTDKEDVVHIYTVEYYSAIKKNEIMPFTATRMDLEINILSEVSQTEKTNTIWYHLYVKSKIWHTWSTETDSQREQTCGCQWGGMDWEFGISTCKLLYIEWINNKVLLYSTGNYIQYPVINHNRKEYEKECIYV